MTNLSDRTISDATAAKQRQTAERIARVCHEANRAYCATLGDFSHLPWDDALPMLRESVIAGVLNVMHGIVRVPGDSHQAWLDYKRAEGWTLGPVKDVDAKTHPNLVPFRALALEEQRKDVLFVSICNTLLGIWPYGTFK